LFWTEARNQGELTQTELDEWTKRHWVTVARPTSARTVHAVVLVDAEKEQGERDRALAVARQVRAAVDGAADAEEFELRARAVPTQGFELRVESLQPVTEDGRIVVLDAPAGKSHFGTYEPAFAQTANALEEAGATSEVVSTTYGYHVLRLVERLPASVIDEPERRARALPEVLAMRAQRALERVLTEQANAIPIELERSADEATSRVKVQP